jgi:dihydroflavonol-4-reductase
MSAIRGSRRFRRLSRGLLLLTRRKTVPDASTPHEDGLVLVVGAGGFLGSHVVRLLVAEGRRVRAFVRSTTNIEALRGLPIELVFGDVTDRGSMDAAMAGCRTVFHCAVNTQAWLRDPAPMHRVNVDGLVNTMDAALAHGVKRFVFTSTIAAIGRNPSGVSTELDTFNYPEAAGPYIRCRVEAETQFFDYVRDRGLPGIAMNVANTYGPGDYVMTPHGRLLWAAATGKAPFAVDAGLACVGIVDAARAMLLAERRGCVGERYIVSERWLTQRQLYEIAVDQAQTGVKIRTLKLPMLYAVGFIADCVSTVLRRDSQLSVQSARLSHIINDMDATRARRELGWRPEPVEKSIREAIDFYKVHHPVTV